MLSHVQQQQQIVFYNLFKTIYYMHAGQSAVDKLFAFISVPSVLQFHIPHPISHTPRLVQLTGLAERGFRDRGDNEARCCGTFV